jgi:arginyl-tRNA--protein-N-Asp/Glu arginylyltransferase
MDLNDKPSFEKIHFYTTTKYSCSYIDKMNAQSLVVTPYKSIKQKVSGEVVNTFINLIVKVVQHVYQLDLWQISFYPQKLKRELSEIIAI